ERSTLSPYTTLFRSKRFADLTLERFGRIDVLVNSAGHGPKGPLLEISDEDWHKGFDVYFMNVARAVRIVAPQMIAQKSGSIVNISTAWVDEPSEMFPTSAVARSGLRSEERRAGREGCTPR